MATPRYPCPYDYADGCTCSTCKGRKRGKRRGGWSPRSSQSPQAGFVRNEGEGDDHLVSFKQGYGDREGDTLITDGNYSDDPHGFDRSHDHYGPGDGPNNNGTRRGRYTGPGA